MLPTPPPRPIPVKKPLFVKAYDSDDKAKLHPKLISLDNILSCELSVEYGTWYVKVCYFHSQIYKVVSFDDRQKAQDLLNIIESNLTIITECTYVAPPEDDDDYY